MKWLKSVWVIGFIAAVINIGMSAAIIYLQKDSIFTVIPAAKASAPPLLWSFKDDEIEKFVAELRGERKKLDARESDMEKLSAQLAAEREELKMVRADIQAMRDQLTATIVEVQDSESKNLKTLAQTYSSISSSAAVAILCEMDETMAVKILSLMKSDKVGAIFQEMARAQSADSEQVKRAARMSDRLRLLKSTKKDPQKP